jgi:Uma2 family endonuclease
MADPARKILTVEALDAVPDSERAELIDGALVYEAMTSFEHGDAQSSLAAEIKQRFGGGGGSDRPAWWIATEVTVEYEAAQAFRHDVAGWRKDRVPKRPVGRRVKTLPDWACEILSTNKKKDLVDKRRVLHAHEVPHYWIVDLDARVLTVLRWNREGYILAATVSPGERAALEPFDAVELDVTKLFGDLDE